MKIGKITVALGLAAGLTGCVSAEKAKSEAIEKLRQDCAAQGKQMVLRDSNGEMHHGFFVDNAIGSATGTCVGPGDPGYVAPTRADTAS